ncbi:hypothetical protein SDC9_165719 [bioreactor metagenome]|uniref:Uncharacterized protein n=1 Tax=bioreactor metagenome TaxID=1076179 RepID=A0A645FXK3_9ZZZZ
MCRAEEIGKRLIEVFIDLLGLGWSAFAQECRGDILEWEFKLELVESSDLGTRGRSYPGAESLPVESDAPFLKPSGDSISWNRQGGVRRDAILQLLL